MKTNSPHPVRRDSLLERTFRWMDRMLRPASRGIQPHPSAIKRIAVIKPCCLGDMLMATPAIRALDLRFPEAEITVVTDAWTRAAIETNPRIDGLLEYRDGRPARTTLQLARDLRTQRFDLGVSLDRSPVVPLALALARVPYRVGIDSHSRGIGLSHRVTPKKMQHETELYLSIVGEIGASDSDVAEYFVPDNVLGDVQRLLPSDSNRAPLVVVHPGGAVNPGVAMLEKRWPATNFGELASLLSQEADVTVVLVGAESDQAAVDTVREFARSPVIDLCGQLSLPELAAITRSASLYVGNDSGTTHLASAVGTPVVAIFGPTNPNRYRPLGRRTRICAPEESWSLPDPGDLRNVDRAGLPDIAAVPLPTVLNACLELLGGAP